MVKSGYQNRCSSHDKDLESLGRHRDSTVSSFDHWSSGWTWMWDFNTGGGCPVVMMYSWAAGSSQGSLLVWSAGRGSWSLFPLFREKVNFLRMPPVANIRLTIRFNFHDLMPTCQVTQAFLQMWSPIVCGCMETGSPSCKWSKFLAPRFYCRPCLFNFWSFRTLTPGILISNIFIVGAFHIPLVTFLSLVLVL